MKKDLNTIISNINSLLKDKKFKELIDEININFDKEKPPVILNILGGAKIFQPNATKEDKISGANDFKEAFQKDNSFINSLINLIRISIELGDFKDALTLAKQYEKKFGYQKDIFRGIARINFKTGNVKEAVKYLNQVLNKNEGSSTNWTQYLIRLNYDYFIDQKEFLKKCIKFSDSLEIIDERYLIPIKNEKNKKIKLGFMSADFRRHPISYLLLELIKTLDKNKFQTFGISNTEKKKYDSETEVYKKAFNVWSDISELTDLEAVNSIRSNNIHVLIHLGGFFDRSRFAVIKNRAAPIQISWMNINTTGVKNMDYLIADKNLIKKDEEINYSEKIIYMPNIWNIHSGFKEKKLIDSFKESKSDKEITLGSFNNFDKLSDKVILVWSSILNKIKKSKLILRSSNRMNTEYIYSRFKEFNVNEKIEIQNLIEDELTHLNSYKKIDIALDTFPTPGMITTFEALWMGVPVITMKGFNLCSRAGESIMKNINMKELICENEEDYVSKVVELSKNINNLNLIKKKIYFEVKNSRLFNYELFNQEFETAIINLTKKN